MSPSLLQKHTPGDKVHAGIITAHRTRQSHGWVAAARLHGHTKHQAHLGSETPSRTWERGGSSRF